MQKDIKANQVVVCLDFEGKNFCVTFSCENGNRNVTNVEVFSPETDSYVAFASGQRLKIISEAIKML